MPTVVHYHHPLGFTPCGEHSNPSQSTDATLVTCRACLARVEADKNAPTETPKPTLTKITAADGSTITVTTRIDAEGLLAVAVFSGKNCQLCAGVTDAKAAR